MGFCNFEICHCYEGCANVLPVHMCGIILINCLPRFSCGCNDNSATIEENWIKTRGASREDISVHIVATYLYIGQVPSWRHHPLSVLRDLYFSPRARSRSHYLSYAAGLDRCSIAFAFSRPPQENSTHGIKRASYQCVGLLFSVNAISIVPCIATVGRRIIDPPYASAIQYRNGVGGLSDFRIPTMPGRSTSGFHQPGRHCLHQARSAERGVRRVA